MARYAVIHSANDIVDNMIRLNTGDPYEPGAGKFVVELRNDTECNIGWKYITGSNPPKFEPVAAGEGEELTNLTPAQLIDAQKALDIEADALAARRAALTAELERQLGG